jgi:hypothetical protein
MAIQQIQPPALPLATDDYLRTYQDQLNNVLRLYFNRMSNGFNGVIGTRGGQYLDFPYGAIQRNTDKSFAANTATQITFDQNDFLNGMRNNGTDGITVEQSGIYNYQFSVQLRNSDTQIHSAWIWLRVNGVDVAGTGSKFDVIAKHGGVDGFIIAACNFYIEAEAGDTVEMWAAVSSTAVTFDATGTQTSPFPMPSIPSVVATLAFVSQI